VLCCGTVRGLFEVGGGVGGEVGWLVYFWCHFSSSCYCGGGGVGCA